MSEKYINLPEGRIKIVRPKVKTDINKVIKALKLIGGKYE